MTPNVPPEVLDGLGVVAVVVLIGWLVVTGRLVPRRTYDDKVHEANEWRTEARIKDQQIAELNEQKRLLAEVGTTVEAIMRGLQHAAERQDP